jgi:hypothetical protein
MNKTDAELLRRAAEIVQWSVDVPPAVTEAQIMEARAIKAALARAAETTFFAEDAGPYSYEVMHTKDGTHYRVRDAADNRVATCYLRENAEIIVRALNLSTKDKP